eukprot:tig00020685_g12918.t1
MPHPELVSGKDAWLPTKSLQVWESSFAHPKAKARDAILGHHFLEQVEVFIPCLRSQLQSTLSDPGLPDILSRLPQRTDYYYRVRAHLATLLRPPFLASLASRDGGSTYALSSAGAIDHGNVVAVYPPGTLHLSLEKDAYEALGLQGRPSPFKPLRGQRFDVEVDVAAPSFAPGKNLYERVQWSLSPQRTSPVDLLLYRTDAAGASAELGPFPAGVAAERVELQRTEETLSDVALPALPPPEPPRPPPPDRPPGAAAGKRRRGGEGEGAGSGVPEYEERDGPVAAPQFHSDLFEWLGLVSCRLVGELSGREEDRPDEFVSGYECGLRRAAGGAGHCIRWRGPVPPALPAAYIDPLRALVNAGRVPFAAVSTWGAREAPVSFGGARRGRLLGGEHDAALVLLPGDRYFLYAAAGTLDQAL